MSGKLRQAARKFADSTLAAAKPLRWVVQVRTTTDRETTGLVEVERTPGVGSGKFFVQVRNSVYLADNDLIWVIKDTGAQGNWTFDGFVEAKGTGESLADSPIPSVATPVVTSPDGTPLIIRSPVGEIMTIGRAGEMVTVAGGLTVTGHIDPVSGSGQDLGDLTHRWDLYTQEVIFGGATGLNHITVPDNLVNALCIRDAANGASIEYLRLNTLNSQPAIVFNAGSADVDFEVWASGDVRGFFVQGSDGAISVAGPSMTVPDNWIVGIGVGLERIIFDAVGDISVMGAVFLIGATVSKSGNSPLQIHGPSQALPQWQNVQILSTDAYAIDLGGSLAFGGVYNTAGGQLQWAGIAGRKQTAGDGNYSGYLQFNVRAHGAALYEAARLTSAGNLGIGTVTPLAKTHVNQANETAAIPVLLLDQGDVDQDMIEFITTIGVGNAIEAIGGKTLTTTHFIKVTLPGSLTRYIPVGTIA